MGGGIITALSVPLILQLGSLWFGIASAVITVLFIAWGFMQDAGASPATPARREEVVGAVGEV